MQLNKLKDIPVSIESWNDRSTDLNAKLDRIHKLVSSSI